MASGHFLLLHSRVQASVSWVLSRHSRSPRRLPGDVLNYYEDHLVLGLLERFVDASVLSPIRLDACD